MAKIGLIIMVNFKGMYPHLVVKVDDREPYTLIRLQFDNDDPGAIEFEISKELAAEYVFESAKSVDDPDFIKRMNTKKNDVMYESGSIHMRLIASQKGYEVGDAPSAEKLKNFFVRIAELIEYFSLKAHAEDDDWHRDVRDFFS